MKLKLITVKQVLRPLLAQIFFNLKLYEYSGTLNKCFILRYHSVQKDGGGNGSYVSPRVAISQHDFDKQMAFLSRNFRCVSLGTLAEELRSGPPNPPTAVLTFDDGYTDNYQYALPILKKYGIPATIFLVSDVYLRKLSPWTVRLRQAVYKTHRTWLRLKSPQLNRNMRIRTPKEKTRTLLYLTQILNRLSRDTREDLLRRLVEALAVSVEDSLSLMLSREHIVEMSGHGVEWGAHTRSHPNLALISGVEAKSEIAASREELQQILNLPVRHFAFPNPGASAPHYNSELAAMVKRSGYESGSTSEAGIIKEGCNRHALLRIGVGSSSAKIERFVWKISRT